MKDISIRRNILKLLLLLGLTQFQCIGVAYEKEKLISTKEEGAASLAHMKSNQSLANDQSSTLKPRDNLFAITPLTEQSYLLAANNGLLVKVKDNVVYEKIDLETNNDLLSIHATDSGEVLLGIGKGGLFVSKGELKNWSKVEVETNESIFNFTEQATGEVVMLGSYGLFMSSRPPYQQWEPVKIPWADFLKDAWDEFGEAAPHLYSGCNNERGELLVVGEFGLALRRDVAGHWSKVHGGSIEPSMYGCDISSDGENIILVGQKGLTYLTSNGGETWVKSDISKGKDLYKVGKIRDLSVIIGDKKTIYTSLTSSEWVCQRFVGERPLGWFVDMAISEKEMAVIGSNGSFKVAEYSSLLSFINKLNTSKELVSCE